MMGSDSSRTPPPDWLRLLALRLLFIYSGYVTRSVYGVCSL